MSHIWKAIQEAQSWPVLVAVLTAVAGGVLGGVVASHLGRDDLVPHAAAAAFLTTIPLAAFALALWYHRRRDDPGE